MAKHCDGGYGDGASCVPGCVTPYAQPEQQWCRRANDDEFCGIENNMCAMCAFQPSDLGQALQVIVQQVKARQVK